MTGCCTGRKETKMTGLDCLKEELLKRGARKQQVESQIVPLVLDIVANSNGEFTDYGQLTDDVQRLRKTVDSLQGRYSELMSEYVKLNVQVTYLRTEKRELHEKARAEFLSSEAGHAQQYADKFFKALEDCETPEARDRLRAAQVFTNTVNIDTKYDNTEYIRGLWILLSGTSLNGLDKLHKMTPDLFKDTSKPHKESADV